MKRCLKTTSASHADTGGARRSARAAFGLADDGAHGVTRPTFNRNKSYLLRPSTGWLGLVAVLAFPFTAPAPIFTGGPAVRVTPNASVELKWITDVTWFGEVTLFDAAGTGLLTKGDEDALGNPIKATSHTVTLDVFAPLVADSSYSFTVTATDPTGSDPKFASVNLPFFTGAQAIGNVFVVPLAQSALVSWDANVIGLGRVEILSPAGLGPFDDGLNQPDHSILFGAKEHFQRKERWITKKTKERNQNYENTKRITKQKERCHETPQFRS